MFLPRQKFTRHKLKFLIAKLFLQINFTQKINLNNSVIQRGRGGKGLAI